MAKLVSLKLDVSKIDKSKIYKGQKGQYLTVTVALNDEVNDYGQDVSCWHEQTQEERQNKEPKVYLGNGKTIWNSEANNTAVNGNTNPFEETRQKATDNSILEEEDDLPF